MEYLIIIGTAVGGIALNMIASDLYDKCSEFSKRLVTLSATLMPNQIGERLKEEWQADIDERRGNLEKLIAAIGIFGYAQKQFFVARLKSKRQEKSQNLLIRIDGQIKYLGSLCSLPNDSYSDEEIEDIKSARLKLIKLRKLILKDLKIPSPRD